MATKKLSHDDYTVAWICPLEIEQIAAMEMLDEPHERLPQPDHDHNAYALGAIQGHNVVIAGLPETGNTSAATVVADMRRTFTRLRFGLLVGIGGGVPTRTDEGAIHLGHVVVSKPTGPHSGAVQYDRGKAEVGEFRRTGYLAAPPKVLLNAARLLGVARTRAAQDPLLIHLGRINTSIRGLRRFKYPGPDNDHLYDADYVHTDKTKSCQKSGCDANRRVDRNADVSDEEGDVEEVEQLLVVHRGNIAVGDMVMKDGTLRDELAKQHGIICFEMEGAGVLNDFPCLIVRGISDYSDSHKNDKWHGYAAGVAAAYARELFFHMPIDEVKQCRIAESDVVEMLTTTRTLARDAASLKIKTWLSPPDPSVNYNEACKRQLRGTGAWFLDSDSYKLWRGNNHSALWLYGIPGCGKTIMSSTIITDLKNLNGDETLSVVYFYFDFKKSDSQSFDKMLCSLISQLYSQQQKGRKHVDDLHTHCRHGDEQPQTQQLIETLDSMMSDVGSARIVLDALDECNTRQDLLSWLSRSRCSNWRILLTSRNEVDIESSLARWIPVTQMVLLHKTPVNEDIRAVICSTLAEDPELKRWQAMPDICREIEGKLMEKADGMFRWAVCQLDALRTCLNPKTLRKALDDLPDGLNETYERILDGIPKDRVADAIRILQFLVYSKRPLMLEEVVDIIAVDLDATPSFDQRERMPVPLEVARICSGLTNVVRFVAADYGTLLDLPMYFQHLCHVHDEPYRGCGRFLLEDEDGRVATNPLQLELAHLSVRDFLLSDRVNPMFKDEVRKTRAANTITMVSIAYLSAAAQMDGDYLELPFTRLSSECCWAFAPDTEFDVEAVRFWLMRLFTSQHTYAYWLRSFDPHDPRILVGGEHDLAPAPLPAPLYLASFGGLLNVVECLLEEGLDTNGECGPDGFALQVASSNGHDQIVDPLIRAGPDVNVAVGDLATALAAASLRGHEGVVQLLIEHGADVNAIGVYYGFALHNASLRGHESIVQLLIEHGADVNAIGGYYGFALHSASIGGCKGIVQLLIDNGADVNAIGGRYGFALHSASLGGHESIAQLLIDNGADVNAMGGYYGFALHYASIGDHESIVRLLIREGAHIDAQEDYYGSSLSVASANGNEHMVRLLVEQGANVNAVGGHEGSPLLAALSTGYEQVACFLINNGADLNYEGGINDNALQAASGSGLERIVRLLIDKGAKVEGSFGGPALTVASWRGHEQIVRLLIEKGADVKYRDEVYGSVIQAASRHGRDSIVRLLAEHGAVESLEDRRRPGADERGRKYRKRRKRLD